jgi:DNA mismatch repair protein MutL
LFDALAAVFGLETARQMIEVESVAAESYPFVFGYAGSPALHRGSRDQLVFFVNKRWIQDRALNQAVVQAYHTFLPVQRYPIAVLNVELDPAEVDVNVHPTKAEVKFSDPRLIFKIVQKAVRETVIAAAPVPTYRTGSTTDFIGSFGNHAGETAPWQTVGGFGGSAYNQLGFEAQRTTDLDVHDFGSYPPLTTPLDETKMPLLRVVGQIQQMYIVTEGPDGLYLIDQHAAHERIVYEKLMAQKAAANVVNQQLLEPILVELSPGQAALLGAEQEVLAEVGFGLEHFGGSSYRIRAVPEMLGHTDPAQALVDILAEMSDGAIPLAKETHEKVAITVCKRASIKGGQTLSHEEMRELVRQLEATQAPRTCPHGRPTMIHLSPTQLAREFGRL